MNTLSKNVIAQLGYTLTDVTGFGQDLIDTLHDTTEHGASGGVSGFIYYTETVPFFDDNREDILDMARDLANEVGEDLFEMVAGFRCLPSLTSDEIAQGIYEADSEYATEVKNALSWFALEETARDLYQELSDAQD